MLIETALFLLALAAFVALAVSRYLVHARERNLLAGNTGLDESDMPAEAGKPGRLSIGSQLRTLRLGIEPLFFGAGAVLFGAMVFLLFLELFPDSFLLASLAGCAVVALAFALLRELTAWRARRFEAQLVDAIALMHAALQGGENPLRALTEAAKASRGAVQTELNEIVKRLEIGLTIEKATAQMSALYDSEGVRLFTRMLVAKWYAGGDLGELLRSVGRIIRERIKVRMRISGQLAGARYASVVVALLPYLVIPVFMWKQPQWLDTLVAHPLGPTYLFAAVMLQIIGLFWLLRILRTGT